MKKKKEKIVNGGGVIIGGVELVELGEKLNFCNLQLGMGEICFGREIRAYWYTTFYSLKFRLKIKQILKQLPSLILVYFFQTADFDKSCKCLSNF